MGLFDFSVGGPNYEDIRDPFQLALTKNTNPNPKTAFTPGQHVARQPGNIRATCCRQHIC